MSVQPKIAKSRKNNSVQCPHHAYKYVKPSKRPADRLLTWMDVRSCWVLYMQLPYESTTATVAHMWQDICPQGPSNETKDLDSGEHGWPILDILARLKVSNRISMMRD